MSIIERTTRLLLTQFTGNSIKPAILNYYTSDMQKIDNAFSTLESDVTGEVADLTTLVNSYETRVSTLETCCSDVNTTLLNYGSRLVEIENVIETVSTANIDDLVERMNALENKVETNGTNINILRNDLHELDERVTSAEGTIVAHAGQLANHENRIAVLESCCSEVRGELTRIEGKVDSNKSEIDALARRVSVNETNIAANAQDITIVSQQTAINTADIEELKQGLAELDPTSQLEVVRQVAINTENISSLQTAVNAQASNLTALTNRVATAEGEIDALEADNAQLHQEIAAVQGWETRISGVESEVASLASDVAAVESTVAGYDTTLAGLRTDVDANAADIVTIKAKNVEYDSKIATDEAALSALTARVGANEADLQQIHATITADESGLASVGDRVTALETQNGNSTLNTTAQTLSGGVNEVNTKVVNADSKATQALSTATTADGKADSAIADISQVASDLSALDGVVGDANSGLVKDVADNASDISDIQGVIPSNASTSNKLATASDIIDTFSTTETKTNKVWIDGKPIYRRCFSYNSISGLPAVVTNSPSRLLFEIANIDTPICAFAYTGPYNAPSNGNMRYRCVPFSWQNNSWHMNLNICYYNGSWWAVLERNDTQGDSVGIRGYYEYTKT